MYIIFTRFPTAAHNYSCFVLHTHSYFNYNIQSNGFICERFTLKFWFVSINCMVCCCACRALLMRKSRYAPVYERAREEKYVWAIIVLFFLFGSRSRSRSHFFSMWIFVFTAMQWIQFIILFWNIEQISYGRVSIYKAWFPFKWNGRSLFVVRAIQRCALS